MAGSDERGISLAVNVLVSRKRLFVILVILVSLMGLLVFRVGYWNIVKGSWLQSEAEMQWISNSKVQPKRGSIFDRNLNVLAQSAASDTVVIIPEQVKEPIQVANALSSILELDYNEILQKASTKTKIGDDGIEKKIGEVWVKRQISHEKSEEIKSLDLKGVKLVSDVKRYYPNKELASQVVGYTDLDGVGQTGIEKRYNNVLEGRQGLMVAETDTHNNDIPNGREMYIAPVNGQNVILTIDEVIQSFMETYSMKALEETNADSVQGLVMAVDTGEILAMGNLPEFDLNEPPRTDGELLTSLSTNKVTATPWEPGNIFSVFAAAAAMDASVKQEQYECTGAATVDGEEIMCSGVHGTQSFDQAVLNGCSVAASKMAEDVGMLPYYHYLSRFGFGEKTGIDFSADSKGDLMAIKYASDSDIAKMSIGENLKVSLLQLANATASMVNGGNLYVPRLVTGLSDEEGTVTENYGVQTKGQSISEETSDRLVEILKEKGLEKQESQLKDYTSGSLYGVSNKYDEKGALVEGMETTTYVGFAPANNPQYLVLLQLDGVEKGADSESKAISYGKSILEETLKFYFVEPDKAASTQEDSKNPAGEGEDAMVEVPNVVDMGHEAAIAALNDLGLAYEDDGSGTVVSQEPAAGEKVEAGTVVKLSMDYKRSEASSPTESGNPGSDVASIKVPDFNGMTLAEARDLAISSGLKFYAQGTGVAKKQYPMPGIAVQKGAAVTVTFRLELAA